MLAVVIVGAGTAATLGLRKHALKLKTLRLLHVGAVLGQGTPPTFPSGVRFAGPAVHVRAHLDPGETHFNTDIPIVKREVRDD